MHPIIGLPLGALGRKGPISCIGHDIKHSLRCIISLGSKSLQPRLWDFFYGMDAKGRGTHSFEWGISRQHHNLTFLSLHQQLKRSLVPFNTTVKRASFFQLTPANIGHLQQKKTVHCNNTTVVGIANNTIKCKHSRSMEMRFFWIGDKVAQEMYALNWHPGQENLADYQSKHHVGSHHVAVRPW